MLIAKLIDIYTLIVLLSVIISWINLPPYHRVVRFCSALTEPVLAPIRRAIGPVSGLDFSPLILLIGLQLLRGILLG